MRVYKGRRSGGFSRPFLLHLLKRPEYAAAHLAPRGLQLLRPNIPGTKATAGGAASQVTRSVFLFSTQEKNTMLCRDS